MRVLLSGCVTCLALLGATQAQASTAYDVDLVLTGATITGTITTDGTIGTLAASDITNYNLNVTITSPYSLTDTLVDGAANNSFYLTGGSSASLFATAGGNLDFNGVNTGVFSVLNFTNSTGSGLLVDFSDSYQSSVIGGQLSLQSGDNFNLTNDLGSAYVIGTTSVTTTPLPAALPLFATSLGAFGLLGWRRKRKSAGATAAA